jgi:hypothetical protein
MANLSQLRRLRWILRLALTLGVTASIAANVLHARDNLISQTIAAWPPLALLLTVELISRVPVHRRAPAAVRVAATAVIAAIAAWVSYWHIAGVAARYGEDRVSAHLVPLCVDGLIVVASISLVELAAHLRALDAAHTARKRSAPAKKTVAQPKTATKHVRPSQATASTGRRTPRKATTPPAPTQPAPAAA